MSEIMQEVRDRLARIEGKQDQFIERVIRAESLAPRLDIVEERLAPVEKRVDSMWAVGRFVSWILGIGAAVAGAWRLVTKQ